MSALVVYVVHANADRTFPARCLQPKCRNSELPSGSTFWKVSMFCVGDSVGPPADITCPCPWAVAVHVVRLTRNQLLALLGLVDGQCIHHCRMETGCVHRWLKRFCVPMHVKARVVGGDGLIDVLTRDLLLFEKV